MLFFRKRSVIMKKIIAVILAVSMIFTCFTTNIFAAEGSESLVDKITGSTDLGDALEGFGPDDIGNIGACEEADIEEMLQNGALNNVNMLGLTVDYLYNSTQPIYWPDIAISSGDLALAKANLNLYLLKLLKNQFGEAGSNKLYTAENATIITNFIGNIINPYHKDVSFSGVGYSKPIDFYSAIVVNSGLQTVIDNYWCKVVNFDPTAFLFVLGFDFDDDEMLGNHMRDADRVSRTLVRSVLTNLLHQGPINYLLTVISNMTKTYEEFMYPSIRGLMYQWIACGAISEDELKTVRGLFNLVVNHNDINNTEDLHFVTPPVYRFAAATTFSSSTNQVATTDTTEMFLYMLVYLNLCGKYKVDGCFSNAEIVAGYKDKINASQKLSDVDKGRLVSLLDCFFCNNAGGFIDMIDDIFKENISDATNPDNIGNFFINMLTNFLKSIAEIFEKIKNSFEHFGEF